MRSHRRTFLKASAAIATSAGSCGLVSGTEDAKVGVRKDVTRLTEPELTQYKRAVQLLKDLPETDRRNWKRQAQIHESSCPHGNWFFLPWHRAYVLHFERICRSVLKDDGFMLPYWNWTDTPAIPAAFWGQGNPLAHAKRRIRPAEPIPAEYVGANVIDRIMAVADFITFGSGTAESLRPGKQNGMLEGGPHNLVHMTIHGDMATMLSPLDPIFWLHHANIDRIWAEWAQAHSNPADKVWLELPMKFADATGAEVESRPEELQDERLLGYRYDTQPEKQRFSAARPFVVNVAVPKELAAVATLDDLPSGKEPVLMAASPPEGLLSQLSDLPINPEAPRQATIRIALEGAEPPMGERAVLVRVFVNHEQLRPDTPPTDRHYVGSFTFFGEDHDHPAGDEHPKGESVRYLDATQVFRRLYGGREYPRDTIEVGLITVDLLTQKPTDANVTARRVRIEAIP